jgi:hypothetical protein
MIHPLRRVATGVAAMLIGLSAGGVVAAESAAAVPAPTAASTAVSTAVTTHRAVWVRDCPGDKYRVAPRQFMIACGDGNTFLKKVSWSNWGARRAHGKGALWENDCIPNCAEGNFFHEPATVTLTRLARRQGRLDYGYLTVIPSRPNRHHLRPIRFSLYP